MKYTNLCKEMNRLHLKLFAEYSVAYGEDAIVAELLSRLAENVMSNKMNAYECAETWGLVIIKLRDVEVLRVYERTVTSQNASDYVFSVNRYPNRFCDFNFLRSFYPNQAALLLSSKSTKEAVQKVIALNDADIKGDDLRIFFPTLSSLFRNREQSAFHYLYSIDSGLVTLAHIKDILKRNVTKPIPALQRPLFDAEVFSVIPRKIAMLLKEENESADELKKWADYIPDYELIMICGLENNDANADFFQTYRELQAGCTESNLSHFLELFLKRFDQFMVKHRLGSLITFNFEQNGAFRDVIRETASLLWDMKDSRRLAKNIMSVQSNDDLKQRINCFEEYKHVFPYLIDHFDEDVIRGLYEKEKVGLPSNFSFKDTPEFAEFIQSLDALALRVSDPKWEYYKQPYVQQSGGSVVPSVWFLSKEMEKSLPSEAARIMRAYENLANVIGDIKFKKLMMDMLDYVKLCWHTGPHTTRRT